MKDNMRYQSDCNQVFEDLVIIVRKMYGLDPMSRLRFRTAWQVVARRMIYAVLQELMFKDPMIATAARVDRTTVIHHLKKHNAAMQADDPKARAYRASFHELKMYYKHGFPEDSAMVGRGFVVMSPYIMPGVSLPGGTKSFKKIFSTRSTIKTYKK